MTLTHLWPDQDRRPSQPSGGRRAAGGQWGIYCMGMSRDEGKAFKTICMELNRNSGTVKAALSMKVNLPTHGRSKVTTSHTVHPFSLEI